MKKFYYSCKAYKHSKYVLMSRRNTFLRHTNTHSKLPSGLSCFTVLKMTTNKLLPKSSNETELPANLLAGSSVKIKLGCLNAHQDKFMSLTFLLRCTESYSFSDPVKIADEATNGALSFIIMHSALPKNFGNSEEM